MGLSALLPLVSDEVKQVDSVGRVSTAGVVNEAVHLYYSQRAMGYSLTFDQVTGAIDQSRTMQLAFRINF